MLKDEFGLVVWKSSDLSPCSSPRTIQTWPSPSREASMELDFDDAPPIGYRDSARAPGMTVDEIESYVEATLEMQYGPARPRWLLSPLRALLDLLTLRG